MFCAKNQIRETRKVLKEDICWAIVRAKELWCLGGAPPYTNCVISMNGEADNNPKSAKGKARARRESRETNHPLESDILQYSEPSARQVNRPSLQLRITKSIEAKNQAIQLKENIDAAREIRRHILEEKSQRNALWKELGTLLGDEVAANE